MSSGLMIYYMHAIDKIGTFGIQNTISHCVGDEVQTKNPESWRTKVSGNETSGGKKILSGLGIYSDRCSRGPCTFTHGDTAEIRSECSGRDVKEEHEQRTKPEVSFPQAGVLGQRRNMVKRIFRLHGWNK